MTEQQPAVQVARQSVPTAERIARVLPHLPEERAAELTRVIDTLVATFQPERVYVFGSQARGEARPDSDVDLMVVVPASDEPPHRRDQHAYAAIGLHRFPVDILVQTRAEFESDRQRYWTVMADVAREGLPLYEAA